MLNLRHLQTKGVLFLGGSEAVDCWTLQHEQESVMLVWTAGDQSAGGIELCASANEHILVCKESVGHTSEAFALDSQDIVGFSLL